MITGNIHLVSPEAVSIGELSGDRRSARRFQIGDLSDLILDINGRRIACKILDISETGAKLETSVSELPSCFVLDAPTQNLKVLCKRVWTDGRLTGVRFLKTR